MAHVVADRVQETTTTSGTGTLTLSGAMSGFTTFSSGIGNGNTTYYTIYNYTTGSWEVGIGTVGAGTLSRDTVLNNSLGTTAKLNLSGSLCSVACTMPAEREVDTDSAETLSNKTFSIVPQVGYSDTTTNNTAPSGFGFKNRAINGAMNIDQRLSGASISAGGYSIDKWFYDASQAGKLSVQRNAGGVTPPPGFKNYLGYTSLSAYTVPSTEFYAHYQQIEAWNLSDCAYGTSEAQTFTLSFWVYGSIPGTYSFGIIGAGYGRGYATTYTINNANTWEYKTITIPGATTGSWTLTFTSWTLYLYWGLGLGSSAFVTSTLNTWQSAFIRGASGCVAVPSVNGAVWYITGIQFEKGPTATPFDVIPFQTDLALCQRYFYKSFEYNTTPAQNVAANAQLFPVTTGNTPVGRQSFPVTMRVAPTITTYNPYAANSSYREVGTTNDIAISSYAAYTWGINTLSATIAAPSSLLGHYTANADF